MKSFSSVRPRSSTDIEWCWFSIEEILVEYILLWGTGLVWDGTLVWD